MDLNDPVFVGPENPDAYIWRYIDFTKFVDLLDDKQLYFSRGDLLGDPFECSYPKGNHDHYLSFPFHVEGVDKNKDPDLYEQKRRETAEGNNRYLIQVSKELPKCTYINCWHYNQHESAAMWKLYLKSQEGIAIRSTVRRLRESTNTFPITMEIGEVKYMDYATERLNETNVLNFVMYKRLSFAHEREIRAVIWFSELMGQTGPPGVKAQVDLSHLIEKVFVAPTTQDWFRDLVVNVCKKYELDVEVKRSSLDEEPLR